MSSPSDIKMMRRIKKKKLEEFNSLSQKARDKLIGPRHSFPQSKLATAFCGLFKYAARVDDNMNIVGNYTNGWFRNVYAQYLMALDNTNMQSLSSINIDGTPLHQFSKCESLNREQMEAICRHLLQMEVAHVDRLASIKLPHNASQLQGFYFCPVIHGRSYGPYKSGVMYADVIHGVARFQDVEYAPMQMFLEKLQRTLQPGKLDKKPTIDNSVYVSVMMEGMQLNGIRGSVTPVQKV